MFNEASSASGMSLLIQCYSWLKKTRHTLVCSNRYSGGINHNDTRFPKGRFSKPPAALTPISLILSCLLSLLESLWATQCLFSFFGIWVSWSMSLLLTKPRQNHSAGWLGQQISANNLRGNSRQRDTALTVGFLSSEKSKDTMNEQKQHVHRKALILPRAKHVCYQGQEEQRRLHLSCFWREDSSSSRDWEGRLNRNYLLSPE